MFTAGVHNFDPEQSSSIDGSQQQQPQQRQQTQELHHIPQHSYQQHQADESPSTSSIAAAAAAAAASSPYPYNLPLIFGGEWPFQFSADSGSPIGQGLQSPLANQAFAQTIGNQPNWTSTPSFSDFYVAPTSMVQYNSSNQGLSSSGIVRQQTQKRQAGRKPNAALDMEDEDDEKKMKRRQRNKEAAARCRQRRMELMADLQKKANDLKAKNDQHERDVKELRKQINNVYALLGQHDCKLSENDRSTLFAQINSILRPSCVQQIQPQLEHSGLLMPPPPSVPPRADSTISQMSMVSSTCSSRQMSPAEDYKPTIDQLNTLPPIGSIKTTSASSSPRSDENGGESASTTTTTMSFITTTATTSTANVESRNDDVFLEPELKIAKMDNGDRTLASLACNSVDDVERPSVLPTLSNDNVAPDLETPSRGFQTPRLTPLNQRRFPFAQPQHLGHSGHQKTSSLFSPVETDLLSSNTGLTPSGQPNLTFVSTSSSISHHFGETSGLHQL